MVEHKRMLLNQKKILKTPLRVAIALLIIGVMFKIQHWPLANWIIDLGFTSIAILYPIRFWRKPDKKLIDYCKLIFVFSWAVHGVMTIHHLPYKQLFQIVTIVAFIGWLAFEGLGYQSKDEGSVKKNDLSSIVSSVLIGFATISTLIGVMFKILHWPGAGVILISGLSLGTLWILKEIVIKKK